ncbi:MAG: chromosome segregation protein SMC [Rhodocyclaceae bacterium]|nr:chromosome segregation protein SMC [Rhodocyclaceae bacterium]
MRLSKLKLAGFKTFVDATTVLTPGALVGIVGPNGCGKSNIIDAVRWVLGESRASALRGASMQDVIFNGTSGRKPVSRASVELVFDNREGRAPGQWAQYAEISVKRVLDRSGESSYFLNGTAVRRRDVIDLFLGTGLGPRAYAIIEQGMISRIIEARPEEIRGFLEEAAGVTKYRERRRETEGRLSDARDNLTRLADIRGELGERLERLQAQAEVAARYRQLQAEHTEKQHLVWLLRRNAARSEAARMTAELATLSTTLEASSTHLQDLQGAIAQAREDVDQASEASHAAQADLYSARAELARIEQDLTQAQAQRQRATRQLEELARDEQQWQARGQTASEEEARWQELLAAAEHALQSALARVEAEENDVPAAEEAVRAARDAQGEARQRLALTREQLRAEEAAHAAAGRTLQALAARRERNAAITATIQAPHADEVAAAQSALIEARAAAQAARAQLQQHTDALPALTQASQSARTHAAQTQSRAAEVRARLSALEGLQARMAATGKLGQWLHERGWADAPAVWQSVRIESGWEGALEAVLRERLGAPCGVGIEAAAAMLDAPPPETFALALPVAESTPQVRVPGGECVPLREKLTIADAAVERVLAAWLAGCYAVESVQDWLARAETLPAGVTLVSRDGHMLARGALVCHAPQERTHGVLERQQEIETLRGEVEQLQEAAREASEAVQRAQQAEQAAREDLNRAREAVQTTSAAAHAAELAHQRLAQEQRHAEEQQQRIGHEAAELARQIQAETDARAQLSSRVQEHEARARAEHEALEAAGRTSAEAEQRLAAARAQEKVRLEARQQAQVRAAECRGKLEAVRQQARSAAEQCERLQQESRRLQGELAALPEEHSLQQTREAAQSAEARRQSALAACRETQEARQARLRELEEGRLRAEHEAAPLREQIGELRLAVQAAELEVGNLDERLREAQADEAALAPLLAQAPREAQLAREVSRLAKELAGLGAVNLAALDELAQAGERKEYLDAQHEDLSQAIETLENAIRRIDRETRAQLQSTYDTVTAHFGEIFPQLFGGGQAYLELTGEEILDAGIRIVAQPPGKKNVSIHLLSGGEKALTAIALVFAMFHLNPAPFCMLDEVDAPLDDANTRRYGEMVRKMSSHTQFLFISHNKITMEIAERLVGVTMQEQGVSRIVDVDMEEALQLAEQARRA